jgi:hypothetical protein
MAGSYARNIQNHISTIDAWTLLQLVILFATEGFYFNRIRQKCKVTTSPYLEQKQQLLWFSHQRACVVMCVCVCKVVHISLNTVENPPSPYFFNSKQAKSRAVVCLSICGSSQLVRGQFRQASIGIPAVSCRERAGEQRERAGFNLFCR